MKKLILVLALLALICPFMGMKLYLTNTSSSGQTQSDPNASLGGYRSTTELSATSMKNLFDDVSVVEALLGDTEYRMIDVYNDGTGTAYGVQLYMQTATSSSSTELDFGYSSTNQPHADAWNGEALSNESTAPASPSMSFSNYTKTSPLSLGTIPASQSKRVCVRRTVTAGAPWTAHDLGRFGVRWGGVAAPAETSQTRYPTGNGTVTWTKGGSSAAATNWAGVDEETADDGVTYNYRADSAAIDRFTFTAFSVPEGATNITLTVHVRQQRTSAGPCYSRPIIRVNGTNYSGASSDPGETWTDRSYEWTTNPNTTEAWTVDDINSVAGGAPLEQFGYDATGVAAGEQLNVTQVYAVVTWE